MIQIFDDMESLSIAAAELFAAEAEKSIRRRNRFSVALAGGDTPRRLYELLAKPSFAGRIDWERVHVFWGDERCVPAGDPRSNESMTRRALLDDLPLPAANIHPVLCDKSPIEAAAAYEEILRRHFKGGRPSFDLILLGLGEDGHTASLFPGSMLQDTGRWVDVAQKAGENVMRVTFTASLINMAASAVFLVSGSAKAGILKEVLKGPKECCRLPAQLIDPPVGRVIWMLDRDAAALLELKELKL